MLLIILSGIGFSVHDASPMEKRISRLRYRKVVAYQTQAYSKLARDYPDSSAIGTIATLLEYQGPSEDKWGAFSFGVRRKVAASMFQSVTTRR